MKKLQILLSIFFILHAVYAQNNLSLTFKYKFLNSNAGYTYPTKMEVYRNGNKIGQSSVKDQTEPNQVTVDFPKGNATITATVFAKINDKWEARTTANNYSLDFQYNKTYDWTKDATIEMVYNISSVSLDINEPDYLKKIKNNSPVIENSSDSENEEYGSLSDDLDKYKSNIDIMNSSSNSTSGYQTSLKKLNDYLKTFDNGYYGYWEVKDGYIYDRFKAGKYNKFKMEDMEGAIIQAEYSRVIFKCKTGDCISTDWKPNGKEPYTQFTKSGSYNYKELADLLNNFRDAYLGSKSKNTSSNSSEKYTESSEFLDGLESMNSSSTTSNSNTGYQQELNKLNEFLKTFDDGFYGKLEVKDGYIFTRFKNGNFNKFKMQDMQDAIIDDANNKVLFKCKDNKYCQSTDWKENSNYYSHFYGDHVTKNQLVKLRDLLNAFKKAYLADKSNTTTSTNDNKKDDDIDFDKYISNIDITKSTGSTSSTKYEAALKKLNDYLPIFNKDTYKNVEVKDGMVYFNFYVFKEEYTTTINVFDLKNKTTLVELQKEGKIKIMCNDDSKCFIGGWNDSSNHFQFFPSDNNTGTAKLKTLIEDFIKAL